MNILTPWLRSYLPELPVPASGDPDRQLAEDLTLRGIAVEGEFPVLTGKKSGTRFEMDITTNRVDAMNHYGVAREAAAIYNLPLQPLADTAPLEAGAEQETHPVRIDAPDLCGRFTARIIRGVTVGPSTGLIADYFAALSQKLISAPVDATNFGWLAMGQPTHVFDLDKIQGAITARRARPGETLQLLDGTSRTLTPDDLVIADDAKALGLAGVMGGWDSRVTEATTNVLVEAAWFDPATVRASSRRHGLHTDASHRFERGADFNAAPLANNLVTRLILQQSGGRVTGPLVDIIIPEQAARTANRAPITLRVSEVQRHLGTTLEDQALQETTISKGRGFSRANKPATEPGAPAPEVQPSLKAAIIHQYLTALGCTLTETTANEYAVHLPSWRLDLEREIDLIEEIARVYGYNRFADTLPAFSGGVMQQPHANQERTLGETLRALGFSQAISSTFVSATEAETFSAVAGSQAPAVPMGNPLSEEAGMLRPALAPGMAAMLALNLHRDTPTVRLFELGTIFTGSTATVNETTSLSLGLTGGATATALYPAEDALFYEAKAALLALLAKFQTPGITLDTQDLPAWITPNRGARILLDQKPLAVFGELAIAESQRRKLRQPCVLAELDASTLLALPLRAPLARELSRFQAVTRDFSFVFPDAVRWQAVETALTALAIPELRTLTPLEIFRDPKGKAVPNGSYSMLTRVTFQSPDRTLTEEELTTLATRITTTLTTLGGTQRA